MRTRRRIIVAVLAALLCALSVSPLPVYADMGPKPSVRVYVKNLPEGLCYGTLLSEEASTGPQYVWDGEPWSAEYKENPGHEDAAFDYETWLAFVEYEDPDGYFFLQTEYVVSETKVIAWTYYPPYRFKILLYFPESDVFVSSGICERYAFDSYFTVDMDGVDIASVSAGEGALAPYRSYDYGMEILSLLARVVLTVLIEIGVALLFGFRKKKQLVFLTIANCVTQVILNVVLNAVNYYSGQLAFLFFFVLLELIVFVVEAVAYCIGLRRVSEKPPARTLCVLYALAANFLSCVAGILLAFLIPGIF